MARGRKLFPIYGSALANNILSTIGRDRLVGHFVDAYIARHDRRGILGGPARERELAETIGREIVLAMIVEVRDALPNFFGKKQIGKLKEEETQAIEAFFREFLAALARAQIWNTEDRRQFRRDLSLYAEFSTRRQMNAGERKKTGERKKSRERTKSSERTSRKAPEEEPAFIARVALLLDPSMLEQARGAAREFHAAIGILARKLLRQTLG